MQFATSIKAVFFFLGLMALGPATFADDRPTITWLSIDWQPAWISKGQWAGQGYAEKIERLLQDRLAGYQHKHQNVINVRIYSILKNREACFAAAPYHGVDLSDEQRNGLVFSAPSFLFFYHGLIAKAGAEGVIADHRENGFVDFSSLIKDRRLKGAFQPGRVYSRWLNEIFSSNPAMKNMFRWSGNTQLTQSMFKMMDAERFDYFVDYYLMLRFHELTEGNSGHYRYYPLLEHKGEYGLGGIACNDTPQGRQLITKINTILGDIRDTPEFRETNSFWLMPRGQENLYWQLWRDEILTRKD